MAGGGSIVNFSSVSYHTMTPRLSVYQAAKAAVIGMSRGLARDLGEHKIRVNSITPGWIMTQRQIELWLTPEAEAQLMQLQCLKEKVYPTIEETQGLGDTFLTGRRAITKTGLMLGLGDISATAREMADA